MAEILPPPVDPYELAAAPAEQLSLGGAEFTTDQIDRSHLISLSQLAEGMGFFGKQYFVSAYRSISIPASFEADQPVPIVDFADLTFAGEFVEYSKVHIGRIIGAGAVRALCLTFNEVTLLPYFDKTPDDHLLHVPVLAVNSIEEVS